jgi:hypothetical protein
MDEENVNASPELEAPRSASSTPLADRVLGAHVAFSAEESD